MEELEHHHCKPGRILDRRPSSCSSPCQLQQSLSVAFSSAVHHPHSVVQLSV